MQKLVKNLNVTIAKHLITVHRLLAIVAFSLKTLIVTLSKMTTKMMVMFCILGENWQEYSPSSPKHAKHNLCGLLRSSAYS